ncbi:hypothetical protein HYW87_02535 [Candidatus Roizmanbacteria bacterium]|nr:hypothetical protein [Candidatus Roizmanbacteria bacterium]
MKSVNKSIRIEELKKMSKRIFGGLVKAVVDIKKSVMVVDADMHADEEAILLKEGSQQDDLWGINLYPDKKGEKFIEFDSIINLRPRLNNFTRGVKNKDIQKKIVAVVKKLILR